MKKILFIAFTLFTFAFAASPKVEVESFQDNFVSISNEVKLAVVIDKHKFFPFIPSLMNALNAYFAQKGIDYSLKLYDIDQNLSAIESNDVLFLSLDKSKIMQLKDYNKTFYLPLLTKNETNITSANIYYGSINFKNQVDLLSKFITSPAAAITDKTYIAGKLLKYELQNPFVKDIFEYPRIAYYKLKNKNVFLNTSAGKTAEILSRITQKNITTKLNFIPQIGYDPLLIVLTQPADVKKLLIANSIINPPLVVNENATLLNSNISYNWLNYASCILANKAYNRQNGEDEFYMSDFHTYIFNNQINYKTKLYKIFRGAFKEVQ